MTQSLTEFLREKKVRDDDEVNGIDWNQRRADWIKAVESLYGMVEQILAEPLKHGLVVVSRQPRIITENYLGTYETADLSITVGNEKVIFSPKGRNVAGAEGRVDVRGESGEGTLALQPGPRWAVVASRYPQLRLVEFNAETLGELLQAVMRQ